MDDNKFNAEWIKLHRRFRKWKYEGNLRYEKVWQTLLFEANYDQQEYRGIKIERGELVFSYRSYLEKLKHCTPQFTDRNLRTIINNLVKNNQIKITYISEKKFSLIKIINYEKYQRDETKKYISKLEELKNEIKKLENENKKLKVGAVTDTMTDVVIDTVTDTVKDTVDAKQTTDYERYSGLNDAKIDTMTDVVIDTVTDKVKDTTPDTTKKRAFPKKYSKKFTNLCLKIVEEMNIYLSKLNMKHFDAFSTKEVLNPIHACFKRGHKDIEEYKKIMEYKFNDWTDEINNRGVPMMKYFTPTTLFQRHFDNYLRQAENDANMGNLNAQKDLFEGESIEDKTNRMLKEAEDHDKAELQRKQEEEERLRKKRDEDFFNEEIRKLQERQELRENGKLFDIR